MGQVSDPYKEGEDEGDLTITSLADDLDDPAEDDGVPSGSDDSDDSDDDVQDDVAAVGDADVQDDDLDDASDVVHDDADVDDAEDDEDVEDVEDDADQDDDDLEEEVAYDLDEFDDDQLDALFDALDEAAIPYLWDGDELFVQATDEQAVDDLLERVANPHAIAAEDGDGDGGGWLLGELFVAADRLQRDPEEHETVASMLQLANASDEASTPYGLGEPEWEQLRERVTALATILEQEDPDPDDAIEAARELRNAVRPYV